MYLNRLIETTIKKAERSFPVIVITGPRQSGKSTLLKNYFGKKNFSYLSFDDPIFRELIQEDPLSYLKNLPKPVVLDEIQYFPKLTNYIKILVDEDKKPGQWFLTGSQQFSVMKNISESLAGRAAILSLPPFCLAEHHKTKNLLEFITRSSYPELIVNKQIDQKIWYSSYLQTYLERDVRFLLNIENLRDFEQCLKLLAARTAQELNYSEISKQLGVSVPTVKRWVSVLEASYLIFLLPQYFNNYGKRIIKAPKLYFYDIGLVNYLLGINSPEIALNGPLNGALFETAVISEILKQKYAQGIKPELYFWRSQSGIELDLIIPENSIPIPYEIKLSSTIKPLFYKNLTHWAELSSQKEIKGFLITNCSEKLPLPKGIKNIYWQDLPIIDDFYLSKKDHPETEQ